MRCFEIEIQAIVQIPTFHLMNIKHDPSTKQEQI